MPVHSKFRLLASGILLSILTMLGATSVPVSASSEEDGAGLDSVLRSSVAAPRLSSQLLNGSGGVAQVSDLEARDLTFYAEKEGISVDEVVARHAGISAFNQAATDIATRYPNLFVKSGVAERPDLPYDFYVQFTTQPSDEVLKSIASLPSHVAVRYGAPVDLITQDVAFNGLLSAIASNAALEPGGASARLNDAGTGILVSFARRDGVADAEVVEAITNVRESAVGKLSSSVPIDFEEVDSGDISISPLQATVKGGHEVSNPSAGACTSGFTANRSGNLGMVTARHCPDALLYEGLSGVLTFGANATLGAQGTIDLQFNRTAGAHLTVARFQADGERTVTAIANPADGQTVCFHGIATNYDCAAVFDPNTCFTVTNYPDPPATRTICSLVQMDDFITDFGDSGGPWFLGSTAHGIHSLGTPAAQSRFTSINRVNANLSATVMQN